MNAINNPRRRASDRHPITDRMTRAVLRWASDPWNIIGPCCVLAVAVLTAWVWMAGT